MIFLPEGVRLVFLFGISFLIYLVGTMILIAIGQAIIEKIDKATSGMEEI